MPPFTPCFPTSLRPDEVPLALLDLVQQRLAGLLGPRFTVVLGGSGNGAGVSHYHLAIQHNQSGVSMEDTGAVGTGFIDRLLRMATQLKAMLDSATFSSMGSDDPHRPLVWISELASPKEMITMHAPT
ncbi:MULTISPECIES: hypothetical protein [Pseudomonas]|uniref:Uncharacterized protein n=1 Tax=Pseudomonas putida TaxID=303 RepID=A0A3M8TH46_PSEPU|nr:MULTISPECIES: hypothetical protein [Pseudomonas]MCE0853275.1 hypothetical protein [Pseudomonas asiatica]MCO6689948.1 hypothetical protein [Pseudomonas shirazica]RNF92433.1 hypothetical protein EFK07_07765 [Pseudomonas putida]